MVRKQARRQVHNLAINQLEIIDSIARLNIVRNARLSRCIVIMRSRLKGSALARRPFINIPINLSNNNNTSSRMQNTALGFAVTCHKLLCFKLHHNIQKPVVSLFPVRSLVRLRERRERPIEIPVPATKIRNHQPPGLCCQK